MFMHRFNMIEPVAPLDLASTSLSPRGSVHLSPVDWRDQILYFLLPDRFSDSKESDRPLFQRSQPSLHAAGDKAAWMASGKRFQGGTIQGIQSKLPYLKQLGVTTLWVGPVWKQRKGFDDYHGYAIQNFLEVDPRFGTRQDLRNLVDAAHQQEMYVILDIIYNHSGNNWFYKGANGTPEDSLPYRYGPCYDVHGWRSEGGSSIPNPITMEDGVWPADFQNFEFYTRAGEIKRWDPADWENPRDPRNEFRRGDFYALKDFRLNELEANHAEVLANLIKVYRYWIALTDCDGFRIDTVKHVQIEASRNFCGGIREYAESIGKENFLLLGEVAGGASMVRSYVDIFGINLDAALDLGDPPKILAAMCKGQPGIEREQNSVAQFFRQFGGQDDLGSHREVGRYHISVLDDHDMIGRGKSRFSAKNTIAANHQQVAHAVGIQLTTLGIPCIYYGTEQGFDGGEHYHDEGIEPKDSRGNIPYDDRYIRECMFGGRFGPFLTEGCHFFDTDHPAYLRIAAIARVVRAPDAIGRAMRRGRQYPRDIRVLGLDFSPSRPGELVAWSRILFDTEILVALNTHGTSSRGADITVDSVLHPPGSEIKILYRGDWSEDELKKTPASESKTVQSVNGRAYIRIDLPASGMMILG